MPAPRSFPTQEEIARAHRRLQRGEALASPLAEHRISTVAPDGSEPIDWTHWGLVLLVFFGLSAFPAYYLLSRSGETLRPQSRVVPPRQLPQLPTLSQGPPARVLVTGFSSNVPAPEPDQTFATQAIGPVTSAQPQRQFATPPVAVKGPAYAPGTVIGNSPPPAVVPAVDYVARERRVSELKDQMEALDTFIRQIRNDPANSHSVDPGGYRYRYWEYRKAGRWIDQEKLDRYLKTLDRQRDELRREKWRLEGR